MLVLLLLGARVASDGAIQFLTLEVDQGRVAVIDSAVRSGTLKAGSPVGSLRIEALDQNGTVLYQAAVRDPLETLLEHFSPDGSIGRAQNSSSPSRMTLRLPAELGAERLRLYRRGTPLGEVPIPVEFDRIRAAVSSVAVGRLHKLLENGSRDSRVNLVILAEGYTAPHEAAFTNDAAGVLEAFLATPPWNAYQSYINAWAIFVPSAEEGSDHPSRGVERDTYFNSSYESFGLNRLLTIPPNDRNRNYSDGKGKVFTLLEHFLPEYDLVLLLVNDSEYGGSGGVPAVASRNASSTEIALHETAHSFAGLGDEYDQANPGYPDYEEPNTTREIRREQIKWRDWILDSTPVPTPETFAYASVVGLFEGAHFHANGWFRPKLDCKMKMLGRNFCEVCQEAIVLAVYQRVSLIQAANPPQSVIPVGRGEELRLEVETLIPSRPELQFTWTIDGAASLAFTSNYFRASGPDLGFGMHTVRVQVLDATPMVRTDPARRMLADKQWVLEVAVQSNQQPVIAPIPEQTWPGQRVIGPIEFMVDDLDTRLDQLRLTAESSAPALLPNESLSIDGNGGQRSLTIRPAPAEFGAVTITLTAADDTSTHQSSFVLNIVPVPAELFILPIGDLAVFEGTKLPTVHFQAGDSNSPNTELQFALASSNPALLPIENIHLELTPDPFLTLEPMPGETGEAAIRISVSALGAEVERTFTLRVVPRPVATAEAPVRTEAGILLRFTAEPAANLVLEQSSDLAFWTVLATAPGSDRLEYLVPASSAGIQRFYRLRLVQF